MSKHKIVIGERTFEFVGPLKFKQLWVVEPAIENIKRMRSDGTPIDKAFYNEIADVILCVTMAVDPTFTRAELDETHLTGVQLIDAYKEIAIASGLYKQNNEGATAGAAVPKSHKP